MRSTGFVEDDDDEEVYLGVELLAMIAESQSTHDKVMLERR